MSILIIAVLCLALQFSSCSDDTPVQPPQIEFDSARFDWRDVQIPDHGFTAMWAADTNKVFLLNFYQSALYIESGGEVTIHSLGNNLYLNNMKGISENEVYIFGADFASGKMLMVKWNGASFEYYPTSITVTGGHALSIIGCAVSSNEIWVCCQDGISKFDGSSFTNYNYQEPQLYSQHIFFSKNNKMQYIAGGPIDTSMSRCTLNEFRDTGFVKIFEFTNSFYPAQSEIGFFETGGEKFGLKMNMPEGLPWSLCVLDFNGSGFSNSFCFNKKIQTDWPALPTNVVGSGEQDFIILVQCESSLFDSRVGIINWNGVRPSRELKLFPYRSFQDHNAFILHAINTRSYIILEPTTTINYDCILHIGTKK